MEPVPAFVSFVGTPDEHSFGFRLEPGSVRGVGVLTRERRRVFMATSASSKSRSTGDKNGAQDLEAEIAKLREEMSKLAEQVAKTRDTSYSAARRAANEGIEQIKVQGEAAMEDLKANARDVEQQLTETVREKPITSLAIAAGVGLLFDVLMRR
jgi:ElaB/YqjD/DUF883 family membrane-anchored ribosome-binding protein